MTGQSTHRLTASTLVLTPLLALLLITGGCSEQQSSESQQTMSPETSTAEVAEPAPAMEPAATETAEAPAVAMAGDAAADGQGIYDKACKACHAAGIAGAPKLGDGEAWAPRVAKGEDALLESIKNGLNAMPPKGACMTCSDDDLKSALQYMLTQTG